VIASRRSDPEPATRPAAVTAAPRVLLLANVLDQGHSGVGRWAQQMLPRLAAELAARGGKLALVTGEGARAELVPDGAEHVALDLPSGPPFARWQREGPALRRFLDAAHAAGRGFDWVHTAHLPVPRRLPRERVRLSWLVHDLRQLSASLVGSRRRLVAPVLYRAAARRADLVCTVSEHVSQLLVERFGRDLGDRAPLVVPNGADHLPVLPRDAVDASSDAAGDANGETNGDAAPRFVVGVGHLDQRKNVAVVLDALALAPDLGQLVWIGRGPERARLERLARELEVAERVTFVESTDDEDLARTYAAARAVVLPSLLEGFGLVAVEALRAGAPLVHARAGSLPEVAGGHGYAFDPTDPHDLVRTMRDAIACGPSDAGRAHAERYTWDRAARLLVDAWCAHA